MFHDIINIMKKISKNAYCYLLSIPLRAPVVANMEHNELHYT